MRTIMVPIIICLISGLTACSSFSGNVVPKNSPTMEQVYDSVSKGNPSSTVSYRTKTISKKIENDGMQFAKVNQVFRKLPNPDLKMYIFPHLAGKNEVPIPGYFTEFNSYEHAYYALPNEAVRV
ncbi:MAG: TIGR03751 family conjugal transfer lipoprotein [Gammaproteobacteria bacterium]